MIRLGLAWAGLMLLLGIEVVGAISNAGWIAWAAAPLMVTLVVGIFMHIARASALSRIFAITGLFWVAILLCLGSVDFFARKDIPTPMRTQPYQTMD